MITPPETRATLRNRVKDGDGFGVFYNDAAGIVADLDRLARIEGLRERIQMEILKFEAFEPSEFVPIMRELLRLLPAEAAPDTRER